MQVSEDRDLVNAPRQEGILQAPGRDGQRAPSNADLLAYIFAALAVALRLFPLVPNFAPIGALCLFGGARMRSWRAYVLPIAVMILSDFGLYLMHGVRPFDPFVYGSFLLSVLLGRLLTRTNSPVWIGSAALASSVQFFLITNFSAWLSMPDRYARSLSGLAECYVKGIPFYRGTFAGDLFYSALFFGIYAVAVSARPAAAAKETV
jgi:hypothetical protein